MPRKAAENERIKDERREEILRAARRVFTRKGLAATKMADLAAAAGVSYGLVYHYFPTKEAVYVALIEGAMRGAVAVSEEALRREGAPWERLAWLTEGMLDGVRHHAEYPLLIARAYASQELPAEARAVLERYGGETFRNVAELLRQGQDAGQVVSGDPRELAVAYFAVIQGLALDALEPHPADRPFPRRATILRLLRA
jgi:AcrR family transcriptional regulator